MCLMVRQATKVFVNGVWVGIHRQPAVLVNTLRKMRRQVDISTEVSAPPINSSLATYPVLHPNTS